jgi:hypothetical protein
MHDLVNSQLLYIGVAALLIGFFEVQIIVGSAFGVLRLIGFFR